MTSTKQRIITILVYADIAAAHDFLVDRLHRVSPGYGLRSAAELGAASGMLNVFVDDVDAHHARSIAAGAKIRYPRPTSPTDSASTASSTPRAASGRSPLLDEPLRTQKRIDPGEGSSCSWARLLAWRSRAASVVARRSRDRRSLPGGCAADPVDDMIAWVRGIVRLHLALGDPLEAGPLQHPPGSGVPGAHRDDDIARLRVSGPALRNEDADQDRPVALAACRWLADQIVNAQRPSR